MSGHLETGLLLTAIVVALGAPSVATSARTGNTRSNDLVVKAIVRNALNNMESDVGAMQACRFCVDADTGTARDSVLYSKIITRAMDQHAPLGSFAGRGAGAAVASIGYMGYAAEEYGKSELTNDSTTVRQDSNLALYDLKVAVRDLKLSLADLAHVT